MLTRVAQIVTAAHSYL